MCSAGVKLLMEHSRPGATKQLTTDHGQRTVFQFIVPRSSFIIFRAVV
jgi:hypothetical protein